MTDTDLSVIPVTGHKKRYLELLLLADEQESMIDRYLERGDMFVLLEQETAVGVCVITQEDSRVFEIKNIAIRPDRQRRGYGYKLIQFIIDRYRQVCDTLLVGTGDSALTLPFYKRCGFTYSHRVPDFFTRHYDHPIYEAGRLLTDMVYLKRNLA